MVRNGFYMPHMKSSIISVDYMQKIRAKEIWCLKYEDVSLKPCPTPPPKHVLIKEFIVLANRNAIIHGIADNKEPDKAWLIVAIAHLKPDHEIFMKSY